MSKTGLILLLGVLTAAAGAVIEFRADALAAHWPSLGPDAWGGTASPAAERGYMLVGLYLMAAGLAVAVVAVQRWLAGGRAAKDVRTAA
jgi:hypothetical protein